MAELIKKTFSDDAAQRIIAAHELGLLGAKAAPAIPFLLQLTDSNNPKSKGDLSKHSLYRQCESFHPFDYGNDMVGDDMISPVDEACQALREIGEPAYKVLLILLKNKSIALKKRQIVSWVLREVFQPSIKELFIKILNDKSEDQYIRLSAVIELSNTENKGVFSPSVKELFLKILADKNEDYHIRNSVVTGLGAMDDPEVRKLFCRILQDVHEDQYIRSDISYELLKSTRIDEKLKNILSTILFIDLDEVSILRHRAGYILAKHADDAMLAELTKILDDKNKNVDLRRQIAEGLGENSNQKAKDILINEINKNDYDMDGSLLSALGNSKSPEVEDVVLKCADYGDFHRRTSAFLALAHINSLRGLEKVVSIIENKKEDDALRWDAVKSLEFFDRKEATDKLFEILRSKDLGGHLDKAASGVLFCGYKYRQINEYVANKWIEALNNKNTPKKYRGDIVLAVGYTSKGTEKVFQALSKAATDEEADVRKNVAFILGKIGTKAEITVLKQLEQDKDIGIKEEAKKAIQKGMKRHEKGA